MSTPKLVIIKVKTASVTGLSSVDGKPTTAGVIFDYCCPKKLPQNRCERLPDGYCARCHSEMY